MPSSNDHHATEIRYRDLLGRLADMSRRIEQVQDDQRAIVDLLRDFRDLGRALAARIESQDRRLAELTLERRFIAQYGERVARHFRS